MSTSDKVAVVCFFLMLLIGFVVVVAVGFDVDDCESRGGAMVETFTGYECVELKK